MARKSLLDSNLPVIESEIEEGNIPFFIIEENYGVACDQYCYSLVKRKKCNRTIKSTDKDGDYIESYYKWDGISYVSTFAATINSYVQQKERELNARLVKSKDYHALINIQNEIKDIVRKAFKASGPNKEIVTYSDLVDSKAELLRDLDELKSIKNQTVEAVDSLMELVKEKRSIILKNTEPKKHHLKLEE